MTFEQYQAKLDALVAESIKLYGKQSNQNSILFRECYSFWSSNIIKEYTMICGKCGEDIAYRLPPDYIDYCPECGVIEGLDNTEIHNV